MVMKAALATYHDRNSTNPQEFFLYNMVKIPCALMDHVN